MTGEGQIIARTPIVKPSPATARGCVVIREFDDEYVVHHAQADEQGRLVGFYWGRYYRKRDPHALAEALRAFIRMAITWHGLGGSYEFISEEAS
jgi:hypothetical protein